MGSGIASRTPHATHRDSRGDMSEGFQKHDSGKSRPGLLPPEALLAVSRVMAHGAEKYEAHNWRKVDDRARYVDALLRHLLAYLAGEDEDPDSGLPTLAHVACNALFLLECSLCELGKDPRPPKDG